jgi:tetratricopeptide (TPR) repeat protein
VDEELEAIQQKSEKDPAAALTDLDAFGKKHPKRVAGQNYVTTHLVLLMQAKKFDEAKAASEALIADAEKTKKSRLLGLVVGVWSAKELNPEKKNLDLVTRAADVMLSLEPKDAYRAARAYSEAGNAAKAAELGAKAIELAEDDDTKTAIKAAVEKFPKK